VTVFLVGFRVRVGRTGAIVKTGESAGDTGVNVSITGASVVADFVGVSVGVEVGVSVAVEVGVSVGVSVGGEWGFPSDEHSQTLIKSGISSHWSKGMSPRIPAS
jgi:hypothetical protein